MRVLKKILLWLLLVAVLTVLIVGGAVAWSYHNTDAAAFDPPAVSAGGQSLAVNGYTWNVPVMGGLLYKSSEAPATLQAQELGVWDQASLEITMPGGSCRSHMVVKDANGGVLLDANNETKLTLEFPANGRYTLEAEVAVPQADRRAPGQSAGGYGSFRYTARIDVNVEPKLEFSAVKVEQGSVITVLLTGFLDGLEPVIENDLSLAQFCDVPGGKAAFIGVHYNREPGTYNIHVACGSIDVTQEVTVVHRDFPRQDLWIDLSGSNGEASSAGANAQWRDAIYPLYELADAEIYWEGTFVRPCEATAKNTEYGLFRYTNGSPYPERHAGIDYDCDLGDAVWSPARGRVVYADYLLATGNTVVVEHGGGLKSFFFHLDSLACAQGDFVEREQVVGYAGTTGYSTGPHLHYEARIGNQSVDPEQLFGGTSGLYFATKRRG